MGPLIHGFFSVVIPQYNMMQLVESGSAVAEGVLSIFYWMFHYAGPVGASNSYIVQGSTVLDI